MSKKTKLAIDPSRLPARTRAYYNSLSDEGKAHFFGFGGGSRDNWDTPGFISTQVEEVYKKGNSFIVLGLDRPNNILSGYGGQRNSHCASIDIVAGRLGNLAASHDGYGEENLVDPNFKLDAARIYLSQMSNPDYNFGLAAGTVGNTTQADPRSTVVMKADTLRMVARENIKLVTKTDRKNSQGGNMSDVDMSKYGINLIAMNDDRPGMLQPLVKGDNLNEFLKELIGSIVELRNLFQNFVIYDRELTQEFLKHTHYSPFYGIKGPPPLDSIDKGAEILINKITNVEVQIQAHVVALAGIQSNYLEAPGGAETIEDGVGLHILSKYNHTN
tara:strand:- start:4751 stop:5740 length:990 start_codon:yes stop_codon:yes gene_type:complete